MTAHTRRMNQRRFAVLIWVICALCLVASLLAGFAGYHS